MPGIKSCSAFTLVFLIPCLVHFEISVLQGKPAFSAEENMLPIAKTNEIIRVYCFMAIIVEDYNSIFSEPTPAWFRNSHNLM